MEKKTFNFTTNIKENCLNLCALHKNEIPLYVKELGYGFVDKTSGIDKRKISSDRIVLSKEGCIIKENHNVVYWNNCNDYNYGGLVFRININEPGAYQIAVTTTSDNQNTWVAVSGMQAERLIMSGWGQVFDDLFDLEKVNVINYSQGGRSFKSMYCEGRFNEVLMKGKVGDFILIQSGHNDEATGAEAGPSARFGRGAVSKSYEAWIKEVYIPSIQSRGMIPILITPMTRINSNKTREGNIELNGFKNSNSPGIDFPGIMKKAAKALYFMWVLPKDIKEENDN